MPYSTAHRERTRQKIVLAARGLFNRHGFAEVTIDQVMAGAGLTRGGFYNHFDSKEDLYVEAVSSIRSCNPYAARAADRAGGNPRKLARMLVDLYLSDAVLEDTDRHCPLYALAGDVARAGLPSRRAYTDIVMALTHVFRAALKGARDAQSKAEAIVSLCVGGMVLARTTHDAVLGKSMRASARRQALALLPPA